MHKSAHLFKYVGNLSICLPKPLLMQKLMPAFLLLACFISCRHRRKEPQKIDATFADEKGNALREISSGSVLQITSDDFKGLRPEDLRLKNIKVKFDGIDAPILSLYDRKILTQVPPVNQSVSKDLTITVTIMDAVRELLKKIKYVPTITATPFAGLDADGKPDGSFSNPAEMVMDSKDNLYVIDQAGNKHDRIIKVTPDGKTSVFLGGDGSLGRLVGIGLSPLDTVLYFSDATALQVKKVLLSNPSAVKVLAGSGAAGNEDGVGVQATFRFGSKMVDDFSSNELGQGMTVDKDGNIYVGESF